MGNFQSTKRMERYYGNYEKSFERVRQDMERVKVGQGGKQHIVEAHSAVTLLCACAHVRRASWGLGAAEDQALGCGALC